MKQDNHRLAGHLSLVEVELPCKCKGRLAELEERVEQMHQQLAHLLQQFLDFKGEPR